MAYKLMAILLLVLLLTVPLAAQEGEVATDSVVVDAVLPPAPPTNVTAADTPDDNGHSITVNWELSTDDGDGGTVMGYQVQRWVPPLIEEINSQRSVVDSLATVADTTGVDDVQQQLRSNREQLMALIEGLPEAHKEYPNGGSWVDVGGKLAPGQSRLVHAGSKTRASGDYVPDHTDHYYRVDAFLADESIRSVSEVFGPIQSSGQWFNSGRKPVLAAVLIFLALVLFFVNRAKKGAKLYVRPLAGIEAVDDAIGRATEMGKPILYVLGLGSAADIATIASFTILGRVAKKVAEYQTKLLVPTYDPIVMSVAQEVVKSAYLDAGRADDFTEDTVHFVTQSQFAYVAAVNGIMLRERPATNIYMGKFFAESLILAETGALAGSIQISGTDEIAQIPFFIVACDYTLIGEELYAASAYLGREPVLLGSLKAQDWAKAAVLILALAGLVAANFGWDGFTSLFEVTN